jgi:hypothetical protein
LLAGVRFRHGAGIADMLAECEAAATVLETERDLAGLADALAFASRLRGILDYAPVYLEVIERAIACARQSLVRRRPPLGAGGPSVPGIVT